MSKHVVITGANRGIGLALTRQYLQRGDRVFGCCRNPDKADKLHALAKQFDGQLTAVRLDVDDDDSARRAAAAIGEVADHVDILHNVAGINTPPHDADLATVTSNDMQRAFNTNVVGPLRLIRALAPLLYAAEGAKVVNFTSGLASISGRATPDFYAYATSKAALNMATRIVANELRPKGIPVVSLDPGWVKTDMGGPNAELEPEESASSIVATADALTLEKTGLFVSRKGEKLDW